MPEYVRTRPRTRGEWVYRALLRVYPREFREEFGDAMVEFYRDRHAVARITGGLSLLRLWGRVGMDLLRNALPARVEAIGRSFRRRRDYHRAPLLAPSLGSLRQEDRMLSTMLQDLRYAWRGMRRAPGFTLTVLATLIIGIGASVTIFSVVNGVLLKPLPYPEPQRIVRVEQREPYQTVSEPEFVDYKRETKALALLAAYRVADVTVSGTEGEPERIKAAVVSEDFFPVLSRPMALGRAFSDDENRRGGPGVAILSHGLWQRRYGGDSSIIGRQVVINERPRTVIGVVPPRTEFPSATISVWLPMRLNYDTLWTRNNHYLDLLGRVAPGATVEQAAVQIQTLAQRFVRDFPDVYSEPLIARVSPLSSVIVADAKPYIVALFGAVIFVLLIACVNVANLMLARGESRRKEIAIRSAMGASRARVTRQALTESLLFAVAGGGLGLVAALGGIGALRALAPADVPRIDEVSADPMVLLFAVAVTLVTGVLFGSGPALRAVRDDAAESLKEGGKTSSGNARGLGRARRTLAVSEIALAVVALSGAGLMMRSLWQLQAIDLGFRPDHVLAVRIAPPQRYGAPQAATTLYERLLERIRALPDVQGAAAVEDLPITDGNSMWSILIDGAPQTTVANAPAAMPQKVTVGYFETMGVPVIRGRTFTDADRADAPLVAVINETMAREMYPGKDAIGGTVKLLAEDRPWATVVGVVRDVRSRGFLNEVPPTMYFPQPQAERTAFYVPSQMWIVARTRGEPSAIATSVRAIVHEIEPDTPIARVQTMDEALAISVASRRFTTSLIAGFALIAVLLAGLGVYGVITYSVNQRQFEMGIRMALGATRSRVVNHVLREGLSTGAMGAAIGLVAAWGATQLLRATLVNVSPGDPLTLTVVTLVLLAVALLAAWVPARRASAVDPAKTIRAE